MSQRQPQVQWRRAGVEADEVTALAAHYGSPLRWSVELEADEYTRSYRFSDKGDRRAEAVFAVLDPSGGIWVHAKAHYPRHIYRLPSGGIDWHEDVEHGLLREIDEEMALRVRVERFLGLIEYTFHHEGQVAHFASYIFLIGSEGGAPQPHAREAITDFHMVLPGHLTQTAAELRNLMGDRHGWGQWRAIAHDMVYESLVGGGV